MQAFQGCGVSGMPDPGESRTTVTLFRSREGLVRRNPGLNYGIPSGFSARRGEGPTAAQRLKKLDDGEELVELGLGERPAGKWTAAGRPDRQF